MYACEGKVGLNRRCKAYSYVVEQECLISKFTPMYLFTCTKVVYISRNNGSQCIEFVCLIMCMM